MSTGLPQQVDNPACINQNIPMIKIKDLTGHVLAGGMLSRDEALLIAAVEENHLPALFEGANRIREAFRGNRIDLCSIINAKSGACPEDCAYCAQSACAKTGIRTYPLVGTGQILKAATEAKAAGARRFCIVTSGRKPKSEELDAIARSIEQVRAAGLLPCATLGLLSLKELKLLKNAGLDRYHHNLETSERFFPEICKTHTFEEKLRTVLAAKEAGLSLCSGGIFGLGENWEDRVDMALAIRESGADSVPINFLIPVAGTALGERNIMPALEALKIISLYRFLFPSKEVRVCGGRGQCLGNLGNMVFKAGADGLLTGNYLTKKGGPPEDDLQMINNQGFALA